MNEKNEEPQESSDKPDEDKPEASETEEKSKPKAKGGKKEESEPEENPIDDFNPGDTVRVDLRVIEGDRERTQAFEGVVLGRRGSGQGETFTVRKISFGVGVEKTFPLQSPVISSLKVITQGSVRRAKLYYLRDRIGKAAKVKQKRRD